MHKYFIRYQLKNITTNVQWETSSIIELNYDKLNNEYLKEKILLLFDSDPNWRVEHVFLIFAFIPER